MPCTLWKYWRLVMILVMLVVCAAASAQTAPSDTPQGSARFLVYFDEFSAFLSDEAKTIIADAAKRARESGARRIVTDQLEADGIARAIIRQEPIGQTGSNDPTVTERRVDVILEP